MSAEICAWQDAYFSGVSRLFDELWGWELEGTEQEKRDISDLYVAGAMLASNHLRVVRQDNQTAAFLGSIFYKNPIADQALQNPAAFHQAAVVTEERLRATPLGRDSIIFNECITEANQKLKADMQAKGFTWQGELKLLMTSPLYQGRGFAKLLVNDTLERMRGQGISEVILYTDSHCNWQYYEKNGWVLASEYEWYFREDPIRALAYWKAL